jgi:hypothetical protein
MPCYQEVRSHGQNRREIPMRKDVPFRDTVRDWDTGFSPRGVRSKIQDCTPSRIGGGKSGKVCDEVMHPQRSRTSADRLAARRLLTVDKSAVSYRQCSAGKTCVVPIVALRE